MKRAHPRQHRSRGAAPDTWAESCRVLFVVLALVAMVLPAGESAVVADDESREAGADLPRCASEGLRRAVCFASPLVGEFEGGPDDDDFRPCPDRACPHAPGAEGLRPLAVRSVDSPSAAGVGALLRLLRQRHGDRGWPEAFTCPALESSVQFLC